MHRILAQEPGGGLLPDWLADAPWPVQALAIVLAAGMALAIPTVGLWGPALADRIRGRTTPVASTSVSDTGSTAAPEASPMRSSGPALQQYDAQMDLINTLVSGLQRSLDDAEEEATRLRARLDEMVTQLAEARAKISQLTYQRDLLLQSRAEPPRRDA